MPTFLTRMRPSETSRGKSGFTLLELMISIVIMGIVLALGMIFINPGREPLQEDARKLADLLSMTRAEAMLARQPVALEFAGAEIFQTIGGKKIPRETFRPGLGIAIDGKPLTYGGGDRITFSPLGHTMERIIHLRDRNQVYTVHVPSIGAPLPLPGMRDLRELHEDKP